jgi:TonB-linked SusC/RagA family outer membrane protein
VRGVVKDAQNEPVIGAAVRESGRLSSGTITDANGEFTFKVSAPNATLLITHLGMTDIEVSINGRVRLDVVMEEDRIALDEVVVTALGIKRQTRALGYAVTEVGGDAVTAGRESNMIQALSGKVAGVDISTTSGGPSGSTRVIIRGNSQLSGSNLPLYVIDGIPMENTQLGSAEKWGGYDYGDGLASISSDDVESISVLKGASAAALYGSRAANGVVLITTKSAKKDDFSVDVSFNVNSVMLGTFFDDYQREYGQGREGRLTTQYTDARTSTQTAWGAKLDPTLTVPIYNGDIKPYGNVNNNILSFFRTGITTTNSIAVSKGSDSNNFRLSFSDMRNWDIVPGSDMSRTTFMFKGSSDLTPKLNVEARANYSIENVNNRPALSDHPNNIGNALIGLAPNFDQQWLATGYKDEYGRYNQWNGNEYRLNPYWVIHEMINYSTKNRVMGHIQFRYDILPCLTLQARAGTDFYKFRVTEFTPMTTPGKQAGEMLERSIDVSETNFEAMLRFYKRMNNWDLSAFIGSNIMQYRNEAFINKGMGQIDANLKSIINYVDNTLEQNLYRKQINSVFGAVNVGYKDYAFLDFTLRRDRSSTVKDPYIYPSVSGSFVFSSFFEIEQTALSFGKIRASWAKVGGDTNPYMLDLLYGLRNFTLQGMPLGQVSSYSIPAEQLNPTSTYSYEIGFDVRFFKDRLGLDFGYYNTNTVDQILFLPISKTAGYEQSTINAGRITNSGIEVSLSGKPVQTKNFTWSSALNLAKNTNQVVELHPESPNYELASARWAQASIYAMEGEAYGVIVGQKFARDPNGNVIFENGMPTYDGQLSVLGNGNYDFTMGFSNHFTYKGFDLGVLLDMKWGADIYSMSAMQAHTNGTSKNTLEGRKEWYESEENRLSENISIADWTPTGGYIGKGVMNIGTDDNPEYVPNDIPVNPQSYWNNIYNNTPEPFIRDASYIKLRELTFSYALPAKILAKTFIRSVSVTAYGRNLWVIYSNLSNIDPESNYNNGNGQGFEYGSLPTRRTFGLGVNIKF